MVSNAHVVVDLIREDLVQINRVVGMLGSDQLQQVYLIVSSAMSIIAERVCQEEEYMRRQAEEEN